MHLCFGLAVGEGLDDDEAAWGWTAVEPDERAVDVLVLEWLTVVWPVVACVPVVAAPAAVRLRARPLPRTAAPMAVPTSGRKIFTQFSLACSSHPRPEMAAGRTGVARRDQYARRIWTGSRRYLSRHAELAGRHPDPESNAAGSSRCVDHKGHGMRVAVVVAISTR